MLNVCCRHFLDFLRVSSAFSDTIQLKDKGAIVGTVVAEKRDQVAVDVGYTILWFLGIKSPKFKRWF